MSDLRLRDVTRDDLPAVLRIRSRSFGPLGTGGEQWWESVADEVIPGRMMAVVDDTGTILASGRARPYEQAWGGRHLPMGGIAGVYVEPSARGRGVGSLLMRGLVERMAELGDHVSCLFATAPELYRGVGYEVGGVHTRVRYAAHDLRGLRSLGGGLRPRPATPDDAEAIHALMRAHQGRHRMTGPKLPSADTWRHQLEDDDLIHYLVESDGVPTGFVAYSLRAETLTVEDLVADTPECSAALWGVVGSGSSAAPKVELYVDPSDPVHLLLPSHQQSEMSNVPWMLRVIDLAKSVAARGFSPHVTASATLTVDDPILPANTGTWRIDVSAGRATATRAPIESALADVAGPAAYGPTVGARGLAALWSGWSVSRLRQAGLATGGEADADEALDAIFACAPFMTEYF